jgi:hypothetical protein
MGRDGDEGSCGNSLPDALHPSNASGDLSLSPDHDSHASSDLSPPPDHDCPAAASRCANP